VESASTSPVLRTAPRAEDEHLLCPLPQRPADLFDALEVRFLTKLIALSTRSTSRAGGSARRLRGGACGRAACTSSVALSMRSPGRLPDYAQYLGSLITLSSVPLGH